MKQKSRGEILEYFKASEDHAEQIYNLVQNTITAVYPRYYPEAVVDFFCSLHNRTNISRDIEDGCVRVLWSDGRMVGTGSCKGSHHQGLRCPGISGTGVWQANHGEPGT